MIHSRPYHAWFIGPPSIFIALVGSSHRHKPPYHLIAILPSSLEKPRHIPLLTYSSLRRRSARFPLLSCYPRKRGRTSQRVIPRGRNQSATTAAATKRRNSRNAHAPLHQPGAAPASPANCSTTAAAATARRALRLRLPPLISPAGRSSRRPRRRGRLVCGASSGG